MTLRHTFLLLVALAALLLVALAACAAPAAPPPRPPAPPPSIEGNWRGQFQRGNATLPVDLEFTRTDGVLTGRFSSPDLRALGIPLRDVRQDGASAHFVLAGDGTTAVFNGAVTEDSLSGAYTETGIDGRFTFARASPRRPAEIRHPALPAPPLGR